MKNLKERARGGVRMAVAAVIPLLLWLGGCRSALSNLAPERRTERLEQLLAQIRDRYGIPAIGAIVVDSVKVIDSVTIGVRDVNGNDLATSDDYFHLGSNTKGVTAFVAGALVEDGVVDWGTGFFDLVPELAGAARHEYAEMTLRDLLSHRAWVRPYVGGEEMAKVPVLEGDILSRRLQFARYVLAEEPTHSSPLSRGKQYAYSNAGYVLAAVMVERATGKSWEELVRDVMAEDLGLRTHVGWPVEVGADQPRGHLPGAYLGQGPDVQVVYDTEYVVSHEEEIVHAGGLCMPMADYAAFIQHHLRGLRGESGYLSAETYGTMHFGVDQYAMGWENTSGRRLRRSEHSGSRGNFFCHVRIVPEHDLAIIAFANSGILNALAPLSYFFGEIRLAGYLDSVEALYTE